MEPKMEDQTPTPPSDTEPLSLEQELQSLKAELEQKNSALQASQDKQLRLHAEFDNYKKRVARDQMEQLRYANEKLLKELLPVLDNLERALSHIKDLPEQSPWMEGVELTYRQWLEALKKFGVTPISSTGELFDPNHHQAVTYLDTNEQPENHVAAELQKGYLYYERVLRPSMVAVARKPSRQTAEEKPEKPVDEADEETV